MRYNDIEYDVFYNTNLFDYLPKLIKEIELGKREKFELGLTDCPYNENFSNVHSPSKMKSIANYKNNKEKKKQYNDKIPNYKDFSLNWIDLMLKCCKGVAFTCGTKHHYDWINWNRPNYHEKYWHKANACSYIRLEPILFFGKIKQFNRICQVINIPLNPKREVQTEHSTPKPYSLYDYLIKKIYPNSVLDCFFGSGTVGQVCLNNNISFTGLDINDYSIDWKNRLKEVKKNYMFGM